MLSWFFIKKKAETKDILNNDITRSDVGNEQVVQRKNRFEQLPVYSETTQAQQTLVSIIMASIAANDQVTSQFVVKQVLQRNPEVELVSLIATSLAAADKPESQFQLKRIVRSE